MEKEIQKTFISSDTRKHVPFNYVSSKFIVTDSKERLLDIVNGRHQERTYINRNIKNPFASKKYFYKTVSRYEAKL